MNEVTSARMVAEAYEREQAIQREEQRHKNVLEEGAKASSKSIEILQKQLSELQDQHKTLSEGYEMANAELLKSKRHNRIATLLSIISIMIAIASLIVTMCR